MEQVFQPCRITSTKCHAIITRRETTSAITTIKNVMGYTSVPQTKEMALGIEMEDAIRQKYISIMTKGIGNNESVDIDDDFKLEPDYLSKHNSFKCSKSGLKVHPYCNFLAATPDGITSCDCCGKSILEIKLTCHFICSTKHEIIIQKIFPDIEFIENLKESCVTFFKSFIVKELLFNTLNPSWQKN